MERNRAVVVMPAWVIAVGGEDEKSEDVSYLTQVNNWAYH